MIYIYVCVCVCVCVCMCVSFSLFYLETYNREFLVKFSIWKMNQNSLSNLHVYLRVYWNKTTPILCQSRMENCLSVCLQLLVTNKFIGSIKPADPSGRAV
jgi:hypothetical protein